MNSKQFQYVVVLAREGSYSRAAEALNISQPSLSQYIRKIEQQVGADLFYRAGGEVRLTDAGRVYLESGRQILDLEKQMVSRISDIQEYKAGSLVVGISPHRSVCLMPRVITRFKKSFPDICVIVEERIGHALLDSEDHGEFDLCITTLPVDEKKYCYVPVMKEEIVLAVPAEHPFRESIENSLEEVPGRKYKAVDMTLLDGQGFVMLSENQLMQGILQNACGEYGIRLKNVTECRSIEAQTAMVNAGLGMALVPSEVAFFLGGKSNICLYSIRQELPIREIVAIYRKDQYLSAPVCRMLEVLRETE